MPTILTAFRVWLRLLPPESADNDPYGEHDFDKIVVNGHEMYWKIDYYDWDGQFRSGTAAEFNTRLPDKPRTTDKRV